MKKTIVALAIALIVVAVIVVPRPRNADNLPGTDAPPERAAALAPRAVRPSKESALTPEPATVALEPLRDLKTIEAAIKAAPENPMLHYRKCQALFAGGREQEAVDHAAVALTKFNAAENNLKWMGLGSITNGGLQLSVHYNMGPMERAEKKHGLVRPLSFRVWTIDDPPKFVRIQDKIRPKGDGVSSQRPSPRPRGRHGHFQPEHPRRLADSRRC